MSDSYKKIVFSAEEKELLVSLLKQEKVVENKRTNKSTNKLKNEAWDRITKKYNCHAFVTKRDCIQLKRCWEKIKKMRKDAITGEIKSRMATGGGSPPLPSEDYVPGVDEVVPHLMYEIPNTVDCDTVFEIERKTEISKTESEWDPQNSQTSFTIVTTSMPESPPMDCTISENRNSLDRDTTPVRRREERTPVRSQAVLQDCNSSMLGRQLDITQSGWDTQNLQLENSSIVINAESPSLNTATISEVASGPERDTTPLQSHIQSAQCQSILLNRNSSVRQSRLGPTANNVISARQKNVLKEGEQQQNLYILRRSILLIEEKQALENLRHAKEMNRIKETDELEKLEHQRELRRIELKNLNKQ